MRVRTEPESNYKAVFVNNRTLRVTLKDGPITKLRYPEFYDIKITNACDGGCPYCYQNSGGTEHYQDIVGKIRSIFEPMTMNQRPLQVAYGGGEPTLHPDFIELLKVTRELGIVPNYTTNGKRISDRVVDATLEYCGGVAISAHPHIHWEPAVRKFAEAGMKPNMHVIISTERSVRRFLALLIAWRGNIDKFVLLPYEAVGRACPVQVSFDYLFAKLREVDNVGQIAFGAGFYEYLKAHRWLDTSLYEPEAMSAYIDLGNMMIYPSSFDLSNPRRVR